MTATQIIVATGETNYMAAKVRVERERMAMYVARAEGARGSRERSRWARCARQAQRRIDALCSGILTAVGAA